MKKILASEIMQSINKSIKPHFENIMKVLWVLAIIVWVFGVLALLWAGGLGAAFGGSLGLLFIVSLILWLVSSLLSIVWW
jgi:hypothetical protein